MRLATLVVALVLASGATHAAAAPASLVLRPAAGGPQVARAARIAAWCDGLPARPQSVADIFPAAATTIPATAPSASSASPTRPAGTAPPIAAWVELRFASAAERDGALRYFAAHPAAGYAEPVRDLHLYATAGEIPVNVAQVRAPEALAQVYADTTLVVGVVDTGCDLTHPDLVRRMWNNDDPPGNASLADDAQDQNGDGIVEDWERDDDDDNGYVDDWHGYDFTDAPGKGGIGDATGRDADPSDDQGHGTHVTGILAADGALQGVAPFVQVMVLRAAYSTPFGGLLETDDAAAAIVYAADNGARILNLSWGDAEESQLLHEAVQYARARGVLVVAAAGNSTSEAAHFPSGQPGVISVGAVNAQDERASFSNFGPGVLLYAPGERTSDFDGGIVSLAPGGGRATLRGTSMAAPHVAGVAAILMCRADRPDAERVRDLLVEGARRGDTRDWSGELSHGVTDAVRALQASVTLVVRAGASFTTRGADAPWLQIAGSVSGSDLVRWRADVRALPNGARLEIHPWSADRVLGSTLTAALLTGAGPGSWEFTVTAESGAGLQRTSHGTFAVDWSAPQVDTLFATAAWRGAAPRWLVSIAADEPCGARVVTAPGHELTDAGRASRLQLEAAPFASAAASWDVVLRNDAGLVTRTTLAAAPVLPAWPAPARLRLVDASAQFQAAGVHGLAPGGATVVWGDGRNGDSLTTMQAWGAAAASLTQRYDTGRTGYVVASADANGDGADDLLYQDAAGVHWLVTRAPGRFPDSLAASARAERALGLFQLDDDAPCEALLSSGDSLFLFDDVRAGSPGRMQTLVNPSAAGFNVFGADAAVGDLDGDGRIEIACGDAEGALAVFERDAAGRFAAEWGGDAAGVYAYDFSALPAGGFLAGRQLTSDVTGDGFPTTVYEFQAYVPQGGAFAREESWRFVTPENELRAGSAVAVSPATSVPYLALVRGGDAYLVRGARGTRAAEAYLAGAAGEPPVLADLDGDGALDVVLRTAAGTQWWRLDEGWRGPHALCAEPVEVRSVRLDWQRGDADTVQVLRRIRDGAWEVFATSTGATCIDSTLVPGSTYEYSIAGRRAGGAGGMSNVVAIRARGLPRVLAVAAIAPRSLRVVCSNPLGEEALLPQHWHVEMASATVPAVTQVRLSAAGREATLLFAFTPGASGELACGAAVLYADSLRDDQGARFAGAAAQCAFTIPCPADPFYLRHAQVTGRWVRLEFTREPDASLLTPAHFTLRWNDTPVPIDNVVAYPGSGIVELEPAPGVELVGRGVPYQLRLDPGLRAAGDGALLAEADTEFVLRVEGRGAAFVFPYPNPVRQGESMTFGETTASTRVEIFDLEGQRVRSLGSSVGGGIGWDLRNAAGERVAPGAYIFVARDASTTHTGRVVVLR